MATGTLAERNPIRYRGYYYDTETGFYYLQSRYYDPQTGRFINADGAITTGQGLMSYNMFAYCLDNPVNGVDPTGYFGEDFWNAFIEAFQQGEETLVTAGVTSQLDSPALGPADIIAGTIVTFTLLSCIGYATSSVLSTAFPVSSLPKTKEQEKEAVGPRRLYNYWKADLYRGSVIVSMPLSLREACLWVSAGGSVMCQNETAANTIVYINGYRNYVGPEIHGDCGYYPQFHPTRNHTGYNSIHIWFYE